MVVHGLTTTVGVTLDMMILHGQAVMRGLKIESGSYAAETISYLVERGIPVMSHVGLRPQSMNVLGGFRARGRTQDVADEIVENAIAAAEAGSFAVVVEGTSVEIAEKVTKAVDIICSANSTAYQNS